MDESYFSYVSTRGNELGNGGYNASIGLAIIPGFQSKILIQFNLKNKIKKYNFSKKTCTFFILLL